MPSYILFVVPALGPLLRPLLVRQREALADADAVLLTRNPGALARALEKIGAACSPALAGAGTLSHLCIVDPRPEDEQGWWTTHPPLQERIDLLEDMEDLEAKAVLPAGGWPRA
jgi:heat shock protein HtpX